MGDIQKRKAPTDPTSGADIRVTTSSGFDTKITRLGLDHQSATGLTTAQPTMATPEQTQTDPPIRKAVTPILRSKPTDRVVVNEDMLNLIAETTIKDPAKDKPSKSKKNKKKRAADNATASAPSPSATTGYGDYTSEVQEVLDLIEGWETNPNNWIDPVTLEKIKLACLDANAQKINEFPKVLAQSVQSLQKEVDNRKEDFEGLKDSADYFLGLEGEDDVTEQLEMGIELVGDTLVFCQQFVDEIKAVQDTLPPVEAK
ncbi:hypothetical protein NU219Hw_g291t1 [Hortaea werneckii]